MTDTSFSQIDPDIGFAHGRPIFMRIFTAEDPWGCRYLRNFEVIDGDVQLQIDSTPFFQMRKAKPELIAPRLLFGKARKRWFPVCNIF